MAIRRGKLFYPYLTVKENREDSLRSYIASPEIEKVKTFPK